MKTLPFKVSAKAARLIGRENVSKAEGAITELVKNAYDADATWCVVAFLPRYNSTPRELSPVEFAELCEKIKWVEPLYQESKGAFHLKQYLDKDQEKEIIGCLLDLWIIDNGTGMSEDIIEDYWMVIGTNFKEANPKSDGGRIRTGEKGIGRFALDRLGRSSVLHSTYRANKHELKNVQWKVDWDNFEGDGKILDEVNASLETDTRRLSVGLNEVDFPNEVVGRINEMKQGTGIRITTLRDDWTDAKVTDLEEYLKHLSPPKGQKEFDIFLIDGRREQKTSKIENYILEDFDYRIDAKVDTSGNTTIKLFRNELESSGLPENLFDLEEMKNAPFDKQSFLKKQITLQKTLGELLPNQFGEDAQEYVAGEFELSLSFYKQAPSSRAERYYYREYDPAPRKLWLEEFGGIKIYRDEFMVRPYGDTKDSAFDWLGLGSRKSRNPAAASRKGWRVEPYNIAGTIHISREKNDLLSDQANREGIISNLALQQFQEVIIAIIKIFEDDRSYILSNLKDLYDQENETAEASNKSPSIAKKILEDKKTLSPDEVKDLALGFQHQKEEIEDLLNDQIVLRNLATLGSILISFAHDMGAKRNTFTSRNEHLKVAFKNLHKKGILDINKLKNVSEHINPLEIIEQWKALDEIAAGWFEFVLNSISGSKSQSKTIDLNTLFDEIQMIWATNLNIRSVKLEILIDEDKPIEITTHRFNLLCIFNNLIVNSLEAFAIDQSPSDSPKIIISVSEDNGEVSINYSDNGQGLLAQVPYPTKILEFGYTTKSKSKIYNPAGTGLGMWIVDRAIKDMRGYITIVSNPAQRGFKAKIRLPIN